MRLVSYRPRGRRQPDVLKGKITVPDSFFDPMPERELKAWEVSLEAVFDQYGVTRLW